MNDIEDILPKDLSILYALRDASPSIKSRRDFLEKLSQITRKNKFIISVDALLPIYQKYRANKMIQQIPAIENYAIKLSVRSNSGVVVITIVLKPFEKSCTYDCFYCADERIATGSHVDVPRSYHSSEPAVRRAIENNYDIAEQFWARSQNLESLGHPIDKIEIILLGGTFSVYERKYQQHVFEQIFWAANTWKQTERRPFRSLQEEQQENEKAEHRIIGIVVETRPDCITKQELTRYREWGVTRVQIGVQHTDNEILDYVNRRHHVEDSIRAIRLLKDFGFKVDIHIMPDLPSSTPEKDKEMFRKVLTGDDFCADYMKIYPCLDVKYAKIRDWKERGDWKPYAERNNGEDLMDVLVYAKALIPRYMRINRLQRDFIPETEAEPGFISNTIKTNLRQILLNRLKAQGKRCMCIRCREIRDDEVIPENAELRVMKYRASGADEYFLEYIIPETDTMIGFIRLRLPDKDSSQNHWIPELRSAALIRELHVYGRVHKVHDENRVQTQHLGFGKRLIYEAEKIAKKHGYSKVAVISGVGVRDYYRKWEYKLEGTYMTKDISSSSFDKQEILNILSQMPFLVLIIGLLLFMRTLIFEIHKFHDDLF